MIHRFLKWSPWRGLILGFGLILVLLAGCGREPFPPLQDESYLIGAYYYQWFPHNFGRGFLREKLYPAQEPVLGRYSSRDVKAVEQHISWCSRYGIDFLALDWWPMVPRVNSVISDVFLKARNIEDIKFCVFYESYGVGFRAEMGATVFSDEITELFVADVLQMADLFFDHPSYLKINGRPVVFFYVTRTFYGRYAEALARVRAELKKKGHDPFLIGDEIFWKVIATEPNRAGKKGVEVVDPPLMTTRPQPERIKLFDAITAYNMYESQFKHHAGYGARSAFLREVGAKYEEYRRAAPRSTALVPGLIPGYNDRGDRPNDANYVIPRQWDRGSGEGSFLTRSFERLGFRFADPRLNMIMITSFNEWNEDTMIEPTARRPATTRDVSDQGDFFTRGYAYSGYGTRYLEVVRDQVCSVAGQVRDRTGRFRQGVEILAWQGKEIVGRGRTDARGFYTLSRLRMPPGQYLVGPRDGVRRTVEVGPDRTTGRVDFILDQNG
jgi:hypothetical protein